MIFGIPREEHGVLGRGPHVRVVVLVYDFRRLRAECAVGGRKPRERDRGGQVAARRGRGYVVRRTPALYAGAADGAHRELALRRHLRRGLGRVNRGFQVDGERPGAGRRIGVLVLPVLVAGDRVGAYGVDAGLRGDKRDRRSRGAFVLGVGAVGRAILLDGELALEVFLVPGGVGVVGVRGVRARPRPPAGFRPVVLLLPYLPTYVRCRDAHVLGLEPVLVVRLVLVLFAPGPGRPVADVARAILKPRQREGDLVPLRLGCGRVVGARVRYQVALFVALELVACLACAFARAAPFRPVRAHRRHEERPVRPPLRRGRLLEFERAAVDVGFKKIRNLKFLSGKNFVDAAMLPFRVVQRQVNMRFFWVSIFCYPRG